MKKLLFALTLVLSLAVSLVAFTSCGGGGEEGCEHIWATVATPDTAATCTEEGSQSIKCLECGEKKADSITAIPAYGHSYDEGTTVPATCTEDGSVTKTCAVCGDVNVTTIPAAGEHTWSADAIVDAYPTCTTDGSKSIKCTACQTTKEGTVEVIPAGHTWAETTSIVTPATCTTDGVAAIKCTVCREVKPETNEVVPAFGHSDINVVIAPTLFSEGRIKGTCSTCGTSINEVVKKASATGRTFDAETNSDYKDFHTFEDILDGDHFYPTEENPDGKSLYIEFSMLWTEEFVNASVGTDYMLLGRFDSAEKKYDNPYDIAYALAIGPEVTWTDPKTPGYFDVLAKDGDPVYGDYTYGSDLANCPFIGGYGWHRIGMVIKQIEKDGSYLLNATLYIDGVKLSSHNIKPRNAANLLYTIEDGEYKDIDLTRGIRAFYVPEGRTNGATVDLEIADLYVTAGNGFVKSVTKLDAAADVTYTGLDGEEREANSFFAYEKSFSEQLYDETAESVEYPVDTITPADGTIDYSVTSGGTRYHRYQANDNKRVAFINVKDIAFNTVNIGVADGATVRYSFLSKMPTEYNEVVSYAINYRTFVDATFDVSVEIPANAAYLVLYYQDNANTKYVPESLTFVNKSNTLSEKIKDNTLETLNYPISSIKPSQGTIATADLRYIPNFDWVAAFVDITDCAFEQVTLKVNGNTGNVGYGFLTSFPNIYDYVEFAGDGTPMTYYNDQPAGTTYTIDIPEDAKVLVIYYQDEGPLYYTPASVTFINADPDESTGGGSGDDETETVEGFAYPMDTIFPVNGYINHNANKAGGTHRFKTAAGERVAFIDLSAIDYDTVTVTSNGETAFFGFLTKIPTANDEVINYAINCNDMLAIDGTVTLAIPANAKYIAVTYMYDSGTICLPSSIVFSDTEDAPGDMLKNDALTSYQYPMGAIKVSQGTIRAKDNYYIPNFDWTSAFIDIEGCVFDKVLIEVNAVEGCVGYGFLTEYPDINTLVSYAGGATAMTFVENKEAGDVITVDIPDDAKVLVVYWHDWNDDANAPVYIKPESITFVKDGAEAPNPGDSEDAEDAETTTPGGSTDSEDAENAGGGASDSEDAETTTPANPGFGSASDAEDAA